MPSASGSNPSVEICAEAGKRAENLQPAAHHHEQRNRVDPMAQPHNKRMLIHRLDDFARLWIVDFNHPAGHVHSLVREKSLLTPQFTDCNNPSSPDLPNTRPASARSSP